MFQFPWFALTPYVFRAQILHLTIRSPTPPGRPAGVRIRIVEGGFPHSEILGSKLVRSSPRLIAAYHVLHRLSAPRHPPNALTTLDCSHDRCPPRHKPDIHRKDLLPRSRSTALLAKCTRSPQPCGAGPPRPSRPDQPNAFPLYNVKH